MLTLSYDLWTRLWHRLRAFVRCLIQCRELEIVIRREEDGRIRLTAISQSVLLGAIDAWPTRGDWEWAIRPRSRAARSALMRSLASILSLPS
jgi:hypothetical protein